MGKATFSVASKDNIIHGGRLLLHFHFLFSDKIAVVVYTGVLGAMAYGLHLGVGLATRK